MSTVSLVPPSPSINPDATREAYARAMDGFAAALEVDGLPLQERAVLTRCYRACARKAHRPAMSLAYD